MKHINFKRVKIKNFLSVGTEPVEVTFNKGLHIITGINKDKEDRRNGVGKSTIADAVYFAVFGETLRDLKKEHIVNNVNRKGCEVELDVEIQHFDKKEQIKIVRTLDPSKCFLHINGEDKTRDSMTNTTSFILNKFSCTPEIFQNCVIMTINNTVPFMGKKKQEKRKFIEDIFNLSVFSNMLTILKEDLNIKKKDFEIQTTRFDDHEKHLLTLQKQKELAEVARTQKLIKYQNRKTSNIAELQQINDRLDTFEDIDVSIITNKINDLNDGLTKIDNKLQSIREEKTEKALLVQQHTKQLTTIGTENDNCPVCLRTIEERDKDHIEQERKKINSSIDDFKVTISNLIKEEKSFLEKKTKIDNCIIGLRDEKHQYELKKQERVSLIARKQQLEEWLQTLEVDIAEVEQSTFTADTAVEEQNTKIEELKSEIDKIRKELNTMDVVKFVVSEEGVKSYMVKKILQVFNGKLSYYLKKMDANCTVTFNEYFEEEIIDNKGKLCSYFNFSGAERKNIDLACLFAFMDMRRLQGDVCFNFSIYDELFDSSLDERGVELVINILKERVEKYNECIMVISHRKESIKAATGDIIFLEKVNGITKRVDFKEYTA